MSISRSLVPAVALFAALLSNSAPGAAQLADPPIRPLGRILVHSSDVLGGNLTVRVLSSGRVLVDDYTLQRLIIYDPSLAHASQILPDTNGPGTTTMVGSIAEYYGDSSLLIAAVPLPTRVVSPTGQIIVGGPPVASRTGAFTAAYLPAYQGRFDGLGNLVARLPASALAVPGPASSGSGSAPAPRDSMPLVRTGIKSLKTEIVTWLAMPGRGSPVTLNGGAVVIASNGPAVATAIDDWTVLHDGTIAVVRGDPFRVDWIAPDGTRTSTPIAHEWAHMTEQMKVAYVDSINAALRGAPVGLPPGRGDAGRDSASAALLPQSPALAHPAPKGLGTSALVVGGLFMGGQVDPHLLPDYWPPMAGMGSVLADAAGNIWIKTTQRVPGVAVSVYDVVDRHGTMIERVQFPPGASALAFGPGVVYLGLRVGSGIRIAKAAIR